MLKTFLASTLISICITGYSQNTFTNNGSNVGIGTTNPPFKTTIAQDVIMVPDISDGTAQLSLQGVTTPGKRMILGYDVTGNGFGFIKAGNLGVTWTNLALQPAGGSVGINITNPATKLHLLGAHPSTQTRLTLPSYENGGGTGDVSLQTWVSEPWVSWDAGGIGMNVTNDGGPNGFGRLNGNIGQSFIRFIPNGGAMQFNTAANNGTYYASTLYMSNGNVGIGTTNLTERLSVNGNIRTRKIIVTQTGWPDYVFAKSYKLRSLAVLDNFIAKHKHLPGVPSAGEVEKGGLDIGSTQVALLKKIEELTLYVIKQDKENKKLRQQFQHLERKINSK